MTSKNKKSRTLSQRAPESLPPDVVRWIDEKLALLHKNKSIYFGYPERPYDDCMNEIVAPFYNFHLNNVGDPWLEGNWSLHTKELEREVVQFFASLYGIAGDHWGYVTTGGTEGNLFGLLEGRACLEKQGTPIVVSSVVSHYSIAKSAYLLGMNYHQIAKLENHEIDYDALKNFVRENSHQPIIFVQNVGTTMTGAIDNVVKVMGILEEHGTTFFVHADAALHGVYYPFMKQYEELFRLGISSIAISGHKFLGTLQPSGVFLSTATMHKAAFSAFEKIPYLNAQDTIIAGSRDGMLALRLWIRIKQKGREMLAREYACCVENAHYFVEQLQKACVPNIIYFPEQTIVAFAAPSIAIAKKFQLPIDGGLTHIVIRPDITSEDIDRFIGELIPTLVKNTCR